MVIGFCFGAYISAVTWKTATEPVPPVDVMSSVITTVDPTSRLTVNCPLTEMNGKPDPPNGTPFWVTLKRTPDIRKQPNSSGMLLVMTSWTVTLPGSMSQLIT